MKLVVSSSPRLTCPLRRFLATGDVAGRLLGIDHRLEKRLRRWKAPVTQLFQRRGEPSGLNQSELQRQPLPLRRRVKLSAATIQGPGLDLDEVFIDEFAQHSVQALFGDPQYLQKFGYCQAWPSADKIENSMMSAPESVRFEQSIGVSDKIAVSEKELFDQFIHRLVGAARLRGGTGIGYVGRHL